MQNRLSAVAVLVVILAICCLGLYVAITGYLNNNPPEFLANLRGTQSIFTPILADFSTDTPIPSQTLATVAINATPSPIIPTRSPAVGAATTAALSPVVRSPAPTTQPTVLPASSCGAFQFCSVGGPPDPALAPSSAAGCPSNYIWGRVVDAGGKGIPDKKIRFRDPNKELGTSVTKNAPDIPGKYDIPSGTPSSQWVVWVQGDDGSPVSPQVTIMTQNYPGSGSCPNRIDFKQQR